MNFDKDLLIALALNILGAMLYDRFLRSKLPTNPTQLSPGAGPISPAN